MFNHRKLTLSLICSIAFLISIGCNQSLPPARQQDLAWGESQANSFERGQVLPVRAKLKVAGEEIALEVAQNPEQQQLGLMYRQSLAGDRGMLFLFESPRFVSFWMKNVVIPLDMIFLEGPEIKAIEAEVPPCHLDPCPVYGPNVPVNQVLELPGGRASELNLAVGDRLQIEFLETGGEY